MTNFFCCELKNNNYICLMILKPKHKIEVINKPQTVKNIAVQIKRAVNDSLGDAGVLVALKGRSFEDSCKNVFEYCKNNMPYGREPMSRQTARTLAKIFYDIENKGSFDCKHYATICALACKSLGIKYKLRLVSQNYFDKQPTHIYCVAFDLKGRELVLDPCLDKFGQECIYRYKFDFN